MCIDHMEENNLDCKKRYDYVCRPGGPNISISGSTFTCFIYVEWPFAGHMFWFQDPTIGHARMY